MIKIEAYPNYHIDRQGRVYNNAGKQLRYLAGRHKRVQLYRDGKKTPDKIGVRQLVAEAFVPIPPHLIDVPRMLLITRSKNGKLDDLRDFNIAWCLSSRHKHPYCPQCGRFHLQKELCK